MPQTNHRTESNRSENELAFLGFLGNGLLAVVIAYKNLRLFCTMVAERAVILFTRQKREVVQPKACWASFLLPEHLLAVPLC